MKKLLSKVLAIVLVITSVLTMFVGCSPAESGKTKIYFANYAVLEQNYTEYWNKVKVDFETEYPDYEVEYLTAGYNDMMTYVANRVGGGDTVDLIFGEVAWAPDLAESGITDPINEILTQEYIDDFYPEIISNFMYQDELYGMPCYFSPSVLYINKDHAEEVGLDVTNPPTSESELLDWCEKLSVLKTETGEKVYPIGIPTAEKTAPGAYINAVITAAGGELLNAEGNLSIDNKGFTDAVEFILELDTKEYNPRNTLPKDLRQMFANGTVSMYIDQVGAVSSVRSINENSDDFTYLAPFPAIGDGEGKTLVHSHSFMMANNGEESAEGTRLLVEFIISETGMADYLRNVAPYFPAKGSMENMELDPIISTIEDTKLNVAKQPNIPELNAIHIQLAKMINSITIGGKTMDEAVAEFEKQVNIMLNN